MAGWGASSSSSWYLPPKSLILVNISSHRSRSESIELQLAAPGQPQQVIQATQTKPFSIPFLTPPLSSWMTWNAIEPNIQGTSIECCVQYNYLLVNTHLIETILKLGIIGRIVKTPTQLQGNLNPTVVGGWTWKWLCKHHPPHPTETQCQLLLTRFRPNFKGRFLRPFWTDLTVTLTFVQATFVLMTFVHIKNISAVIHLILTKL